MRNKNGSHVGIILSFVIFVTFALFIYAILEPGLRSQREKQSLLEYLKGEISREISASLTTATLSINKSQKNQGCVELENFINLTEMNPPNIIVKNESGIIHQANVSANKNHLRIFEKSEESNFFKIYNSSEFQEINSDDSSCKMLSEGKDYTIGLIRTEIYFFESRIINLTEEYKNDYQGLKARLKMPSEFDFSFLYEDGTIIKTSDKDPSTNVYATEFPIQYINKNASIRSGFINLRVW